jgi:hypothetical protein
MFRSKSKAAISGLTLCRHTSTKKWGLAINASQCNDSIIFQMVLKIYGLTHLEGDNHKTYFITIEQLFGVVPFVDEFHDLESKSLSVKPSVLEPIQDKLIYVDFLLPHTQQYFAMLYRDEKVDFGFCYHIDHGPPSYRDVLGVHSESVSPYHKLNLVSDV